MKICSHCQQKLEESFFYKDSSHPSGLQTRCKECTRKFNRKMVKNNKTDSPFSIKTIKMPKSSHPEHQWNKRHYKAHLILVKKAMKNLTSDFPSVEKGMKLVLEESPDLLREVVNFPSFKIMQSEFCSSLCVIWINKDDQFMVSYLEP